VHVTDVSNAYIDVVNSISSLARYTEFEVGTGSGLALKCVCKIMHNAIQEKKKKNFPALIFAEETSLESIYQSRIVASKKSIKYIDWKPNVDIVEGITRYVKNEL
jgi:nucleoside-diphosphate-sugar epimerase